MSKIKRRNNNKLEKFIVANINKEIKNSSGHCDFIQMQYFFESVFDDKTRRKSLLKRIYYVEHALH